jgi:TonB family protein
VNDAIDRLISERAALDRGFPGGLLISGTVHLLLVGAAIAGPLLLPKKPLIQIQNGFVVPLPPGGGGSPNTAPPAPAPPKPEPPKPKEEAPEPEPPKKQIIKPPKEEQHTKGVAPLESKPSKKPAKITPGPPRQPGGGPPGGTAMNAQTLGLGLEVGAGVPGGTDPNGDWYLAGVQRSIWALWTQQIHGDMSQSVTVRFTITSDGSVEDVQIVQPSGVYLLDTAAQRAVMTAAPFSPLPKTYDTNRLTIQAIFKATS